MAEGRLRDAAGQLGRCRAQAFAIHLLKLVSIYSDIAKNSAKNDECGTSLTMESFQRVRIALTHLTPPVAYA